MVKNQERQSQQIELSPHKHNQNNYDHHFLCKNQRKIIYCKLPTQHKTLKDRLTPSDGSTKTAANIIYVYHVKFPKIDDIPKAEDSLKSCCIHQNLTHRMKECE